MTVSLSVERGVAWITIDTPPINLFDTATVQVLLALAERAAADDAVRVAVFQSANPEFFVAHFDIDDVYRLVEASPRGARELNLFQQMIEAWRLSPKLSIAKVAGICRGAGTEFVLGLDLVYAVRERAVFSLPETFFGFPPGGGSCQYIGRKVTRGRALEFVLSGEDYDAATAERWGLVVRALPQAELDAHVARLAERIGALPLASAMLAKKMVGSSDLPLGDALREGNAEWVEIVRDPALHERIGRTTAAFRAAGGQTLAGERDYDAIRHAMGAA